MRQRLNNYRTNDGLQRWEKWASIPMALLAALFLFFMIWHLFPIYSQDLAETLDFAEETIWTIFVIEFAWRIWLAPTGKRWRYVWTHPIDVLIIVLPFLRPLRLLTLFAAGGVLAERSNMSLSSRTTVFAIILAIILLVTGAYIAADFEQSDPDASITNFAQGLWWALVTMTTVGYGDFTPTTGPGYFIGVVLMIVGIGLAGVITATVASWFVRGDSRSEDVNRQILDELAHLRSEVAELKARNNTSGQTEGYHQ